MQLEKLLNSAVPENATNSLSLKCRLGETEIKCSNMYWEYALTLKP